MPGDRANEVAEAVMERLEMQADMPDARVRAYAALIGTGDVALRAHSERVERGVGDAPVDPGEPRPQDAGP